MQFEAPDTYGYWVFRVLQQFETRSLGSIIKGTIRIRLNFYRDFADNNCCEKGKPLERVGRKAIGPIIMGGGVARHMDTLNTGAHSLLERMGFFYLPEVMNHEIIIIFWYFLRVRSSLSNLYFFPVMGSGVDNIFCTMLGHGCRSDAYPRQTKD